MTNGEWLDYLAHNAPDELAAWFDAEHVEHQERALDGDTEPENEDSREQLEADVFKAADDMEMFYNGEKFIDTRKIIGWLDRQAAITEREYGERMASEAMCSNVCAVVCEQRGHIAELQVEVDELTAERDELQAKVDELRGEGDTESSNLEWLFKNDREALIDGITCINPSCAECKFGNPDDDAYCALNEREWLMAPHVDANDGKAPNRPTSQPDALNLHPIERKCGDLRRKVDELEADNDRLAKLLSKSLEEYSILEAERDEAIKAYDAHMAAHDAWHEAEDITYTRNRFAIYEQVTKERIAQLESERDELMLKLAGKPKCEVCDRTTMLTEIEGLTAERDILKANNEQLHTLAGEQAAKIDELQSAFDAICANLSIIANGEPDMLADIAIETIDALIDECNTANRQCNEYRKKFGKCLDYADAIHALMDDEGMA